MYQRSQYGPRGGVRYHQYMPPPPPPAPESVNVCDWVTQLDPATPSEAKTFRAPMLPPQQMVAHDNVVQYINTSIEIPRRLVQHHLVVGLHAYSVVVTDAEGGGVESTEATYPTSLTLLAGHWPLRTLHEQGGAPAFSHVEPLPAFALTMKHHHSTLNVKMRFEMCADWYRRIVVLQVHTIAVPRAMTDQVRYAHLWLAQAGTPSLHFMNGVLHIEEDPTRAPEHVRDEMLARASVRG